MMGAYMASSMQRKCRQLSGVVAVWFRFNLRVYILHDTYRQIDRQRLSTGIKPNRLIAVPKHFSHVKKV